MPFTGDICIHHILLLLITVSLNFTIFLNSKAEFGFLGVLGVLKTSLVQMPFFWGHVDTVFGFWVPTASAMEPRHAFSWFPKDSR